MEFMIRDRLSWMRFLGFELGAPMPDESTIRLFREKLTESGALRRVMKAFDWQLRKKGYIPMSGQIVDASLIPAPKQRNTSEEKEQIKDGKTAGEIWPDEPNKAAQKDTDARPPRPIWPRSLQESDDPPSDRSWTVQMSGKTRYATGPSLRCVERALEYPLHFRMLRPAVFLRVSRRDRAVWDFS